MSPPRGWRWLFRNPFRDRAEERAVRDEIRFHLEELEARYTRSGLPPGEAHRQARARFGDPERWEREAAGEGRAAARAEGRRRTLLDLGTDLRMAFRQMTRNPRFTALLLLVMTVGVAAGTTVWGVVDAVLFKPLPFPDADRVVAVPGGNERWPVWFASRFAYEAWDDGQRSFEEMAVVYSATMTLLEPRPEEIGVLRVESRFFDVIRTQPMLGRAFTREEDLPGAPNLLILTWALWRDRFGSDPDILGTEVGLRGGPATVVGVMPPSFSWEDFQGDGPAPEGAERLALRNGIFRNDVGELASGGRLLPLGRLRPGVSLDEARADLDRVGRAVVDAYPEVFVSDSGPYMPTVRPLRYLYTRFRADDVKLLAGAALLVLLLVAVNTAGLFATRVLDRRTELGVRASLGAGRIRLARQLLVETGVPWALALATGLLLAGAGLPWVRSVVPAGTAFVDDVTLRPRVLVGCLSVATALWLLSALLPSLAASRMELLSAGKAAGRGLTKGGMRAQKVLIVGQIALACGLLGGATLLLRHYARLRGVEIGLDPERTAMVYLDLPPEYREPAGTVAEAGGVAEYARGWFDPHDPVFQPGPRFHAFVAGTLERMEAVPGVTAATFVNQPPLWESTHWRGIRLAPPGVEPDESYPWVRTKWVTPDYFETLGIPVRRGRGLLPTDTRDSQRVVVINEAVARTVFGSEDPVGRTLSFNPTAYFPDLDWTVVGVVPPVLQYGPHEPDESVVYIPVAQLPRAWADDQIGWAMRVSFLARYRGSAEEVFRGLREAVWAGEPEVPITKATTLEHQRAALIAQPRFFLLLLGGFATVALLLSAVGVLATLGQQVHQRTGELGIRKALGADVHELLRRTLADGAVLGGLGVLVGTGLEWLLGRGLHARIAGAPEWSPAVLAGAATLLFLTAVLAALPAGLRASRVDPMEALRTE